MFPIPKSRNIHSCEYSRRLKKLGNADKLRFMNIAQGSLEECRYYILLSKDLNYITENNYFTLTESIEEVSKLLNAYCKSIAIRRFND